MQLCEAPADLCFITSSIDALFRAGMRHAPREIIQGPDFRLSAIR